MYRHKQLATQIKQHPRQPRIHPSLHPLRSPQTTNSGLELSPSDHTCKQCKHLKEQIEKNGSVNALIKGQTLLHQAAKSHNGHLIASLLDYGANPFTLDSKGKTAVECMGENADKRQKFMLHQAMEEWE